MKCEYHDDDATHVIITGCRDMHVNTYLMCDFCFNRDMHTLERGAVRCSAKCYMLILEWDYCEL